MELNFIKRSLNCLHIYGLHPGRQDVFSKIRTLIGVGLLTSMVVLDVMEVVINWKGIETLARMTEPLSVLYQIYWKIWVTIYFRKNINFVLDKLNLFWFLQSSKRNLPLEIRVVLRRSELLTIFLNLLFWICLGLYFIRPFLKYGSLPILCYQPEFLTHWPGYETLCFLQWVHSCFSYGITFGFDLLLISLGTYVCCELKLLQNEIRAVDFCEEGPRQRKMKKKNLIRLINHHDFVLGFIKELNTIFSTLLLNLFLSNVFSICMGLFLVNLSLQSTSLDIPYIIKTTMYLSAFLTELFIYCVIGSNVIEECVKVADAGYYSNWWKKHSLELRKTLQIIIVRGQKQQMIWVGGMFGLDLGCIFRVLKTAFSFFSLMRAVYSKTKHS